MSTIDAGTITAAFKLKNEASASIKAIAADMKTLAPATAAASKEVKKLEGDVVSSSRKYGELADSVGRTATTMARSASVFGLNADALRAVDDAADIAELGLNNLSKSAAGLNAASLGVAGAGLAVGSAIGSWLNTFPAVRSAADALTASLYKLFGAADPFATKGTEGLKAWQAQMKASFDAAQKMQDAFMNSQANIGVAMEKVAAAGRLKEASTLVGHDVHTDEDAKRIIAVKDATLAAAAAAKQHAEDLKREAEAMAKLRDDMTGVTTLAGLDKTAGLLTSIGGVSAMAVGPMRDLWAQVKKLVEEGVKLPAALQPIANLQKILAENQPKLKAMAGGYAAMGKGASPFEALGGEDYLKKRIDSEREQIGHLVEKTFDWQGALQGVALIAGTIGGNFGQVLGVVGNIGEAFSKAQTSAEKFNAIASGVGQIGGMVGGKTGGVLQGAAGGAQLGMSIAGPYGAAIGAVAGGIMGFFKKKHEEMVKAAQQAGVDIAKAIAAGTDATKFLPALLKDKKTALATFDQLGEQFTQLQDKYKAAILDSTKNAVGGLTAMISYLGKKTGDTTADFQRMGTYVMGIFYSLRKQGMSFLDAVNQIKPSLDAMRKQAEDKGIAFTGPSADLAHFTELIDANKELVAAAEGAGQVLSGLRVSGSLTAETFANLQADVNGYIAGLEQAGFAPSQALAVAAPSLYQLKKAHEDLGYALDAETQKQVDAAQAAGLFEGMSDPVDEIKKSMDAMVQVLAAIATAFGATLPAAVQQYINALNSVPSIPGPPGMGGGGGGEAGAGAEGGGGGEAGAGAAPTGGGRHRGGGRVEGSFASGVPYLPRDMVIQAHEGERIVPKAQNVSGGGGTFAPTIIVQGSMDKAVGDYVLSKLERLARTNQGNATHELQRRARRG